MHHSSRRDAVTELTRCSTRVIAMEHRAIAFHYTTCRAEYLGSRRAPVERSSESGAVLAMDHVSARAAPPYLTLCAHMSSRRSGGVERETS